ncbi:MAG: hypothetical protein MK100_09860, partial [Phycisphaerales bacterium]|nr:hypothetical protein [Phycisphaerales bacterium]
MGFTPFSVSDELELRMNEGNNQPWLLSRFERSLSTNAQHDSFNGGYYFRQLLRSASVREENGELSDQLSPRQLMHDTRRKLTLFNGARNEHLPPWLWWENRGNRLFAVSGLQHGRPLSPPVGLLGVVGAPETSTGRFDLLDEAWLGVPGSADSFGDVRGSGALAQFYDQMRLKLDLREHERFIPAQGLGTSVTGYRPRTFSERLPMALYLALTSGDLSSFVNSEDTPNRSSNLFDDPAVADTLDELTRTRELAASYAANMLAFRDPDSDAPLFTQTRTVGLPSDPAYTGVTEYGAVRPPVLMEEQDEPTLVGPDLLPDDSNPDPHYLGMEMQPFILESFVAHVHKPWSVPDNYVTGGGGGGFGNQPQYYRWDSTVQPKFVDYTPGYESSASFATNQTQSRQVLQQQASADKIQKPDTIAVVQIANPYDRPLPLFGRDSTGAYNRNLPLYKIKLFGKEAVIDDDLSSVGGSNNPGHLTTMRRSGYVNLGGNPDVLADSADRLPWFLPPATGDAPYTLTMFITSIADPAEKAKWIDFLDIHPGDHFFTPGHDPYSLDPDPVLHPSHPFLLSRDVDLDGAIDDPSYYMELRPGQLICEV